MPQLFAAAYLVPRKRRAPSHPGPAVAAFYASCAAAQFPYDIGDDPAFFAARHQDGPITWGVCRPDARSLINPGDWMVFFSAEREREAPATTRYRFVAAFCVERKVSHTDIFSCSSNELFRAYLNLLVRPHGLGWDHHEPALHPRHWHDDWLWRICQRRGLRKPEVVAAGRSHNPGAALSASGRSLPIADNYVIFSRSSGLIAPDPPLVATHSRGEPIETWKDDPRSKRLRHLVFDSAPRGLRTSNLRQPHRHFRRPLADAGWINSLRTTLGTSAHAHAV